MSDTVKRILHAGCGGEILPQWFPIKGQEVRLDADATVEPKADIIASIDNMGDIGEFDALWCCHTLEHLHWHKAMKALREFCRVLKPGGLCMIEVPNLEGITPNNDVVYVTGHGLRITGLDMYYGYREFSYDNEWMIHRCGFVLDTLTMAMEQAGFQTKVMRTGLDLLGMGVKPE